MDARTDVYGLGVVFYELLTGAVPFAGPSLARLRQRILTEPPQTVLSVNGGVPPELERICLKCLSKAADDRHGSAEELAEDFTSFLQAQ